MCQIKIGQTQFKNTDFIYYAINKGIVELKDASIITAHPPVLGEMLIKKEVDIAPIPSILYGKYSESLVILPGFSISSNSETKSILVFSDRYSSLEELEGESIAIPGTSASSSALLEIILKNRNITSDIVYHREPDIQKMLQKAGAALLIGDHALIAVDSGRYSVISDLGKEWHDLSGRKMVYALWTMRREFADRCSESILQFLEKLKEAKKYAYNNLDKISAELAKKAGISPRLMKEHLLLLDYGFDEDVKAGLREYFRCAKEAGIIDNNVELRVFEG